MSKLVILNSGEVDSLPPIRPIKRRAQSPCHQALELLKTVGSAGLSCLPLCVRNGCGIVREQFLSCCRRESVNSKLFVEKLLSNRSIDLILGEIKLDDTWKGKPLIDYIFETENIEILLKAFPKNPELFVKKLAQYKELIFPLLEVRSRDAVCWDAVLNSGVLRSYILSTEFYLLARNSGNPFLLKFIADNSWDQTNGKPQLMLLDAIKRDDATVIESYNLSNVRFDAIGDPAKSPLTLALSLGKLEVARSLLRAGHLIADEAKTNSVCIRSLQQIFAQAIELEDIDLLQAFLTNKIKFQTLVEGSYFTLAFKHKKFYSAAYLLELGYSIPTLTLITPVSTTEYRETFTKIVQKDPDLPDFRNAITSLLNAGITPYSTGGESLVKIGMDAGNDAALAVMLTHTSTFDRCPIQTLNQGGYYSPTLTRELLERGENPFLKNKQGVSAVSVLIERGDIANLKIVAEMVKPNEWTPGKRNAFLDVLPLCEDYPEDLAVFLKIYRGHLDQAASMLLPYPKTYPCILLFLNEDNEARSKMVDLIAKNLSHQQTLIVNAIKVHNASPKDQAAWDTYNEQRAPILRSLNLLRDFRRTLLPVYRGKPQEGLLSQQGREIIETQVKYFREFV